MDAEELILAAERISIRCARPGDADILAKHILATVHPDDDDPVTVAFCEELGLVNRSTIADGRVYEIAFGIRLLACAGMIGFKPCHLWVGFDPDIKKHPSVTRGQLRKLLAGLGMEK